MPQFRKPAAALIADSDLTFLTSLSSDPKAAGLPPVLAKTGKEAQILLADSEKVFAGVFINTMNQKVILKAIVME